MSLRRLGEFLPQDKKATLLNLLLEVYKEESRLANVLKCHPKLVSRFREGKIPGTYLPRMLALALHQRPETRDILQATLTEFRELCKAVGLRATQNRLTIYLQKLDEKSKAIVGCLLTRAHANIRELAAHINAPTDNEVLHRVREIINPTAKEIMGKEIMRFEKSKVDPATGEKILYSWWLSNDILPIEVDPLAEVFEEKDWVRVVAQLPAAREEDINIEFDQDIIVLSTDSHTKKIPLFFPVKRVVSKSYRNGVLELRIEKNA